MNTTLYPGIPFSPQAQLTDNIGAADTIIEVSDVSAFPPAPNLATIGTDEEGETILYTAKTETALSGCQRGVEGEARGWTAGELIGRNFTAKDHADLIAAATEAYGAAEAAQEAAATAGSVAAAKQPKLTGEPGQVVGFGADGAAVAVQGWSNQNLLINSGFRNPVNRNGRDEYTTAGMTIDRWMLSMSAPGISVRVLPEGISIDKAQAGVYGRITQSLDNPVSLSGATVTVSILAKGDTTPYLLLFLNGESSGVGMISIPLTDKYSLYSRTLTLRGGDLTQVAAAVGYQTSAPMGSCALLGFKLERGPVQTLARQNEDGEWEIIDPPDYDRQYALCSLYSPITGEWAGNQHSNPNLMDNWYFADPVNQRGQAEYTAGCSIDRWIVNYGVELKIEPGGISVSVNSGVENPTIYSPYSLSEIPKGMMVFSVIGNGVVYSMPFENDGSATPRVIKSLPTAFGSIRAQVLAGNKFLVVLLVTQGTTCFFQAAKLELGPIQTLARQDADGNWVLNDPPPNKALELAKCQRYQVVYGSSTNNFMLFTGKANTASTRAYFSAMFPQPLAKTPVLTINDINKFYVYDGTNHVPKTVQIASSDNNPDGVKAVTLMCDIAELGVESEAGTFFSLAAGAQIIFDANI